jgi:type II secretory pathway predicted ATPase ExeA
MVLDYYKLAEQPFGVTPDPRYLYLGSTHREALASALYGVNAGRGFTALIAKPGMGKTTLLFDFLYKVRNHAKTVFLFQSQSTPQNLLRSLLADLGIDDDGSDVVRMHRKLNDCLVSESRQGKRLIVVIDEAQNLDESVLEVVRMLSNFETPREKLMHLILAGQPQLAEKLASPRLIQLRQRISMIARLKPFTAQDTQLYIDHRLRVAGYAFAQPMFTKNAHAMIADYAEGIPRNINNVCFNAMSLGCVEKQRTIDIDVIKEVVADLDLRPMFVELAATPETREQPKERVPRFISDSTSQRTWFLRFALVLLLIVAVGWLLAHTKQRSANVFASAKSQVVNIPEAAPSRNPSPDGLAVPAPVANVLTSAASKIVLVLRDETLYQISMENFGRYDDEILAKLREFNPWLSDPNHIQAGQMIRVPDTSNASRNHILPSAERAPAALGTGADKP